MELAPYIRELILHNECIILRGFGGFETEYLPARFDASLNRMLPPSKRISFRQEYTVGGELLEKHLVKVLHIQTNEAGKLIEDYIKEIRSQLALGKKAIISGVGDFQIDTTGSLVFNPLQEENYLADSFGLEPLPVTSVKKEMPVKTEKSKVLNVTGRSDTLRFVIVGALVIGILLTITIILSSRFNVYLFNIGDKGSSDELIIGHAPVNDTSLLKIDQSIEKYTSVKQALSIPSQTQNAAQSIKKKEYLLIAGSFATFANALELQKSLTAKGIKTTLIRIGTDYSVCLARFSDKETAATEMERFQKQLGKPITLRMTEGN